MSSIRHHNNPIHWLQKNLSDNLLIYTLIIMFLGVIVGYYYPTIKILSSYTTYIVIGMIYPMMVNMSIESVNQIKSHKKPMLEALIINFIWAPLLFWLLSSFFVEEPSIRIGLMFLAFAPASSMGLGYLGLSEGNILLGAMIVVGAFLLSLIVYPLIGPVIANGASISVSSIMILKSLLVILILPLVLGILTRYLIIHKSGIKGFKAYKPYFSTVTLILLYLLMFVIFSSKALLLVKKWSIILEIIPVAITFYLLTIGFAIILNKYIFHFSYEQHQAIIFTSASKNVALSIAILLSVFNQDGLLMSVAPAVIALIQAPTLMLYLKYKDRIKAFFGEVIAEIEEEIHVIEEDLKELEEKL